MEYRRLGNSGLQVSVIGLGTNNFGARNDYPAAERVLKQALEEGINFIETSNTYGGGVAEEFIGQALKGSRDQVLLATKVASNLGDGPNQHGASRKHIMAQVEVSLNKIDAFLASVGPKPPLSIPSYPKPQSYSNPCYRSCM